VWAERFNGDTADLFALQDEITSRVAIELNIGLVRAEAARPKASLDVLDCIFRGRAVWLKPPSRDNDSEGIDLFKRALARDPDSAEAQNWLALALLGRVLGERSGSSAADIARAEGLVAQALPTSPNSPLAHYAKGNLLRAKRRYADAIPEYEVVIALDRNSASAYASLGQCKFFTGSLEEVVPLVERAIRLSPRDRGLGFWYGIIGRNYLLQSRTDDAIFWSEKARSAAPDHPFPHTLLASAYGLKGESERAVGELAEWRRLFGKPERLSSIAQLKATSYLGVPKIRALFEATYFAGLRLAGMPEE
jgi:adenylate cyclase